MQAAPLIYSAAHDSKDSRFWMGRALRDYTPAYEMIHFEFIPFSL
jgi:hypothetical protein